MITENLYPTYGTSTQGVNNELTLEYTETVGTTYQSIAIDDVSAYYLGWIRPDNLPSTYKRGAIYCDSESNKVVIKAFKMSENMPCTYVYPYNLSSTSGTRMTATFIQTIDGVKTISTNPPVRLYNQLYPEYAGVSHNNGTYTHTPLQLNFITALFDGGDNLININAYSQLQNTASITFGTGVNDRSAIRLAYNFLYKGEQAQIHFTWNNTTYYFNCVAGDFANGTAYLEDTTGNYHARFFLTGYYMLSTTRISGNNVYPMNITFCAKVSGTDHNGKSFIDETTAIGRYTYTGQTWHVGSGSGVEDSTPENPLYLSGLFADDEIDLDEVLRVVNYSSQSGYPYGWSDTVVFYHINYNGTAFYPLVYIDDIKRHFALNLRVDISGSNTPSYVDGLTYATDVTSNNEFTAKLKTGDITNETFKNGLREWQYENIQSDDFTEDDIPPYTPPGPEPRPDPEPPEDDAEHGGDDIEPTPVTGLGGTFGFTTQYAMRGNQLEQLGSALWAGFDRNNPDIDAFIQNFVYSVDPDTGSVNMADIMEFFISLRAYPIPLGNLTSISSVGTDFYIGSGTAPLRLPDGTTPFTENLHTADSYIEPVNAGTVSIPFWFGDYRDYKTEITLYLPYCGTAELNPADVMGCTLDCTYVVDLSTGSCTAYVWTTTWENKKYPVAILPGQLGVDIPITATNAGRVGARLLGDRINFAENIMSVLKNTATGIGAVTSGNIGTGIRATMSAFIDPAIQEQKQLAGMADRGAIAAPMLSGGRGLAAFRNPATAYVQVRSPFYAVPEKYADTVGDPAATRVQIRDCHGFNQFVNVDVSGITTDAADQAEIRRALENGIYI